MGNKSEREPRQKRARRAWVEGGYLWQPAGTTSRMGVESLAWFAWLEQAEVRSFAYAILDQAQGYIVGYMTVRKERRQRGGCYWVAYRREGGHLHKVYLGRSAQLTRDRLSQAVAQLQGASAVHGSAGVGQK